MPKFLLIFYENIFFIDLGMQAKFKLSDQFDKLEFTLHITIC